MPFWHQAVFDISSPDTLTVGSLSRLAVLLGEIDAIIRAPELKALDPSARPERIAQSRGAARPFSTGPSASDSGVTSKLVGSLRIDSTRLAKLLADADYINQKRELLAFIDAGDPMAALRVMLRGQLPPAPLAAAGAAAPASAQPSLATTACKPLSVFHFLLSHECESWLIDPELRSVDTLRALLPAYAGASVLKALKVKMGLMLPFQKVRPRARF